MDRKGSLSDHEKRGRKYLPQMAQLPVTSLHGLRDSGPDFIWPSMVWILGGDEKFSEFVTLQRTVLGNDGTGRNDSRPRFDGRLSTLESWTPEQRAAHRDSLIEAIDDAGLLPDSLLAALRLYPEMPGAWLLVEPWAERDLDGGAFDGGLTLLARALANWGKGDHLNALTKYLTFCWAALAGGMTWDPMFSEYLKDFPGAVAKRSQAASMIRAGYSVHQGALAQSGDPTGPISLAWSSNFWRTNWALTDCILPDDSEEADKDEDKPEADAATKPDATPPLTEEEVMVGLVDEASTEYERLMHAFFDNPARDLNEPLPDEVISGLTLRAITSVVALLRAPHQWSSRFASVSLRQMAETEILLAWFDRHPEDFVKYRDYGLGHEKLSWLHVEDMVASLPEVPSELQRVTEKLEERKRTGAPLDMTVVSIEATFNGISTRRMAQEVGLDMLYRSVFQAASGEIHGEWEPLQREDLIRCMNPLHRFHLVPSPQPLWEHDQRIPAMVLRHLSRLVDIGVSMLNRSPGV